MTKKNVLYTQNIRNLLNKLKLCFSHKVHNHKVHNCVTCTLQWTKLSRTNRCKNRLINFAVSVEFQLTGSVLGTIVF